MVCADNIPMSPAKHEAMVGIHFTWFRKYQEILNVLPSIEKVLAQFNAKPHYGKLFILSAARLQELLGDDLTKVKELIKKHDPKGKFQNAFTKRYMLNGNNAEAKL